MSEARYFASAVAATGATAAPHDCGKAGRPETDPAKCKRPAGRVGSIELVGRRGRGAHRGVFLDALRTVLLTTQ